MTWVREWAAGFTAGRSPILKDESLLAQAAVRAAPLLRDIFECRTRLDTMFRITPYRIVDVPAGFTIVLATPFRHHYLLVHYVSDPTLRLTLSCVMRRPDNRPLL